MDAFAKNHVRYSSLKQTDDEPSEQAIEWMDKYQSAFTYAAYNDLDNMGYEAPKRYPAQRGPRYQRYTYTSPLGEYPLAESPSLQTTLIESVFVGLSFALFLLTLPVSLLFSLKFVGDFERLVVLRLGRAQRTRGPGATLVLPCIDSYTKVDLRVNAFNVPPMQIITIDRGLVELGATVYLQIKDALAAVCAVQERNHSTRTLAVATLHRLVCKKRVCDIDGNTNRRQLAESLKGELGELTISWGLEITNVEVSDVKVIKEGENMALATFKKVLKSEFGNQLLEKLGSTVQDFIDEEQTKRRCDAIGCDREGKADSHGGTQDDVNIDELLYTVAMVIDEKMVAAVGLIFQVECAGLGEFYVDLKNGCGACSRGRVSNPDVTFQLNRTLFFDVVKRRVSVLHAFMNGSLKVIGPVQSAMKLSVLSDRLSQLV